MSEKNILYYYQVCGLSIPEIAVKVRLSESDVKAILSKPPSYPLAYTPRQRYSGWVYNR